MNRPATGAIAEAMTAHWHRAVRMGFLFGYGSPCRANRAVPGLF